MGSVSGALIYPVRVHRNLAQDGVAAPPSLYAFTKVFAFFIVFLAGWYLCLPETEFVDVPWWAAKHKIGGRFQIHELIFAGYLVLGGYQVVRYAAQQTSSTALPIALSMAALAGWCAITSLLGPHPAEDIGRSARLLLMAALLLTVTFWASRDTLFILRVFLLGLAASSVANLVLTFMNPVILVAGALPRLLGQNAPGPPMGIALSLAAWLILISRNRWDAGLAVVTALICAAGVIISYSKTGMLAAAFGGLSIVLVTLKVSPSNRGRLLVVLLAGAVGGIAVYMGGESGRVARAGISVMFGEKVASARPGESQSMNERMSYFVGVAEIVAKRPLGVGYSGFRDAMMATGAYASGLAADEGSIPASESNPHSLFLYYTSAGGVPGAALTLITFALLCAIMVRGLGVFGVSGAVVGLLTAGAYMMLAISIQTLFNQGIMLIPAAIAAGLHLHFTEAAGRAVPALASPAPATGVET
jgi:O-antigen ligase